MNAQLLARRIVEQMTADSKQVVNDKTTDDSVVEHDIDVDVIVDGYVYNVNINVCRFGIVE